jgi:hypothetical protein
MNHDFDDLLFIYSLGYILYCLSSTNEMREKECSPEQTNYTFAGLLCGSRYDFSISACNSIGQSEKRQITGKTRGSTPIAPDKETLLASINATSVLINLFVFRDGGCPLLHYALKYKRQHEKMWTRISDYLEASKRTIVIDGLHSHSWYHLQITAYSQAGSSEAEYSFLTMMAEDCE